MVVLTIEHASYDISGTLKRYMYEIRPGVYVGTVSAKVREKLWEKYIETNQNIIATMIWSDSNEQGFSAKIHGEPKRKIVDYDGINMITIAQQLTEKMFIAKTNTRKDLLCHMYETGIVAQILLTKGALVPFLNRLVYISSEEKSSLINCLSFLAAAHDIGKIHPDFQICTLHNERLLDFSIEKTGYPDCRHEQFGAEFLSQWLSNLGFVAYEEFGQCIYTHHQGYKPDAYSPLPEKCSKKIIEIGDTILRRLYEYFQFPYSIFSSLNEGKNGIFSLISATINFCDWIASSENVFDEKRYDDFKSIEEYSAHVYEQAKDFITTNHLVNININDRFGNIDDSFNEIFNISLKRPLQEKIYEILKTKEKKNPSLYIIEDSCGAGKTESAFHVALKANPEAIGFYMALPTSATAEAMQEREQSLLNSCEQSLPVPAFEGKAWLSDKNISIEKECWLHPSRQKMFYPYAVGTVDQLIEAVQTVKYGLLRLLALTGKTIIIDEMHAYDAYMLKNLEMLLSYCGLLGISVIILSATLPKRTKARLFNAYTGALNGDNIKSNIDDFIFSGDWHILEAYPLITEVIYDAKSYMIEFNQYPCMAAFKKDYSFEIISALGKNQNNLLSDMAYKEIEEGGCLAIILNTVAEASSLYTVLKNDRRFADTKLLLVHAQCTLNKKDAVSNELIKYFGKDRAVGPRPQKAIVVSTQIIEQSLDVDFDFMFTAIAPIDLLIQRLGRYRRHQNTNTIRERKEKAISDTVKILVPEENEKYGATGKIYSIGLLNKTIDVLYNLNKNVLRTPMDTRRVVDEVYDDANIDILAERKMQNSANAMTLNNPYDDNFVYYRTCRDRNFRLAKTRLTSYESFDVAIVDEYTFNILKNSKNIDINLAKKIMKENTIYNVAWWKLKEIENKKEIDKFDDTIHIKSGELKGYLSDLDIYCADENGLVKGFKTNMAILNGELIFGL